MDENSTTNNFNNHLPSPDFAAASLILLVFIVSMVVMVPSVSTLKNHAQVDSGWSIENLMDNEGETLLFALPSSTSARLIDRSAGNDLSRKPLEPELKINSRRFKFPPFKGKDGEHIYHPMISKASEEHNVDPALVKAIIMAESSYNPHAVSPQGAVGLMQLMPHTAKSLGVKNSFNPEQNIQAGTKYLKELIDQFDGDLKLALAAYNAGPAHVLKHNGVPPFKDTEYYLHKVYHYYVFYKNQDDAQLTQDPNSNQNASGDNVDEA